MITRRRFLFLSAALPVLAACSDDKSNTSATATTATTLGGATTTTLAPTPACTDADDETPALTEGPYFKTGSPEKSNLYADVNSGTKLTISGTVLSTTCKAVDKAKIEVWQADPDGEYDNSGNRLRGHLFTDASGRYQFLTVVPGIYTGRTRHIHIKVQAPNGPVLTTQLFFPGDAELNARDSIYREECLLTDYTDGNGGKTATFNFVVAA
jgi:protocatechuate 3,4-dioxygenase beta subunit